MTIFEPRNVQGNVLLPYTHRFAAFTFLRVAEATTGRQWLHGVLNRVTTAEPWTVKPTTTFNLQFTFGGLRAMGLSEASLNSFPPEFQSGMAARASVLGDTGKSDPAGWETPGPGTSADVHVLAAVYGLTPAALEEQQAWLASTIAQTGGAISVVSTQLAQRQLDSKEHFGFADGIAQPALDLPGFAGVPGDGAVTPGGGWRPLKAGEFLLGHLDEEDVQPAAPSPPALGRDGCFVVYRKLRQEVALFRRFVQKWGYRYPGGEPGISARIMGRWPDGTPVVVSPHAPVPDLAVDDRRNNNFVFAGDASGYRCPIGAHVRRANPRDALPFAGRLVNRHRIIRRGIPYGGEPLPDGIEDDGQERGLLFICLQASISRQFEFVQSQWLNDGNLFGQGEEKDLIAGTYAIVHKMVVQGSPPVYLWQAPQFVSVRGGEYFFLPGMRALRFIASGPC